MARSKPRPHAPKAPARSKHAAYAPPTTERTASTKPTAAAAPPTSPTSTTSPRPSKSAIAILNDQMRRDPASHGEVLFDATLAAKPAAFKSQLFAALAAYDGWYPGSDPRGHHDFGLMDVGGMRVLFQFQYRNKHDRRVDADDPSDATTTHRILRLEHYPL